MSKVLLIIFLFLSFPITTYSWETVPVPDYVDKKTKSPWNFYDDFEDKKLKFEYIKNSKEVSNSPGITPYKFKQDDDGNTYLEITVKNKWNKCCGSNFYSERAEIYSVKKKAKNKTIWYGFRIRFPENFVFVEDRLMFSQFMNEFQNMKKSPLMGMHLYDSGKRLVIGGDTGGVATKSWNPYDHLKFKVENSYLKYGEKWNLISIKRRDKDEIRYWTCNISTNNTVSLPDYCKNPDNIIFLPTKFGEWSTYKIGIKNSDKEDGYIKVYKDNILIMDYEGITFGGWKGSYKHTFIKLGPYRDTDPSGKGYPDQTIHYDDFIIVSDKKTLDKYLD